MIDNIWTYRTRHFLSRCRQERDKTMLIRTHVSFGDEILMSPCIFARRSCFPPIMSTSATSCTPHGEDVMRYYICTLSSFPRRSPLLGSRRNEKTLDYIRNETSADRSSESLVFTYFDNSATPAKIHAGSNSESNCDCASNFDVD